MSSPVFGSYDYWHPKHKPSNAGANPAVNFVVKATTPDCQNGVIEFDPLGGARLVAVEDCRTQCLASDDAALHDLGNGLPQFWAWPPALTDASISPALTDAQRFNIMTNSLYALGISNVAGRFVPIFTDNKPDPSGKSIYIAGAQQPDHGSFDSNVALADIAGILQDAMKRSALRL